MNRNNSKLSKSPKVVKAPVFGLFSIGILVILATYHGFIASAFYSLFDIRSWPVGGWFAYIFFYLLGPFAALVYTHDFYPALISTGLIAAAILGFWLEGNTDE